MSDIKWKYNNSIINKRINQAVQQRESHSESVERRININKDKIKRRNAAQTITPNRNIMIPKHLLKNKSLESNTKSRASGLQIVRTKYNTNCTATNYNTIYKRDTSAHSDNQVAFENMKNSVTFDDTLKRMLSKQNPMVCNLSRTFYAPVWKNPMFKTTQSAKNRFK